MLSHIESFARRHLSPRGVKAFKALRDHVRAFAYRGDLIRLGICFETDKWGAHWYLQHYQRHFCDLQKKPLNLLEIGIGGYKQPDAGGNSLRTWKAYFPQANIYGIDIYDKKRIEETRIQTFQGSQTDPEFLKRVIQQIGGADIIIDDGSHINSHVITTFKILFPLLRDRGIYVIEDTQTSYWPGFGGSSDNPGRTDTIMGYFTSMVHSLNHEEILRERYEPSYHDLNIVGMHFYHNLIFVEKGSNNEGSTVLRQNRTTSQVVYEGIPFQPQA